MKREERDPARQETILLLIERLGRRLSRLTQAAFTEDSDEIDLASYRLAMIGEEARKLSDTLKERHQHIPWIAIYGMRNVIAHEYMRVSPERIWLTATQDLAPLADICRQELDRLSS